MNLKLAKLTLRYAHASLPFPVVGKKRHHLLSLCSSFGPCDSPSPVGRRSLVEVMATGAPDSQARFGQSVKGLLTEKVNTCGTDVIALTKQVLKGSRSSELLGQAARNMVLQEDAILHSEDSLRKMAIITTHLQYQQEAIQKNVEQSSNLQDQLNHLLK
ncbi:BLOC-1-related complex subunit 7 [Monodon monoceros]|uniref:BLOC-1-related complex subunit 7 n=4 Tax=Odontoceti TaxID=9722 RepID=A0A8C6F8K9_MONMO|nr:BLOC-1-related complex subunit 7 [Delphinapterus leucas]XP_029100451.1 BLOC-1-related complex subunit 7 [Monodon monoceros]XP_032463194.1 BLOC-1-related complex subunit 7 [Phocoena sinus]